MTAEETVAPNDDGGVWDFADAEGKFWVTSAKGFRLACQLDLPSGHHDGRKVAVLCHGLFSHADHPALKALSDLLLGRDAAFLGRCRVDGVVRFSFHGNGESEGEEAWSLGDYDDELASDMRIVVEFLREKKLEVDLLAGHSRGGNEVLMYSWTFDDIPHVMSLSARFNMSAGFSRHFTKHNVRELQTQGWTFIDDHQGGTRKVTQRDVELRQALDMTKLKALWTKELPSNSDQCTRWILLVHGSEDRVIPCTAVHQLEDSLRKPSNDFVNLRTLNVIVRLVPRASHSFTDTAAATRVIGEVLYE